jgi:hypothetical protein
MGLESKESQGPKQWKPEFSEEELAHLTTLSGKEKKRYVAELRAKYLKQKEGV